jgi:hypothetical protein
MVWALVCAGARQGGIEVCHDHAGAFAGEALRDGGAQAASGAGDEDSLVLHHQGHGVGS